MKHVSQLHPALMALQYPLLFPYGEKGFYLGMKYASSSSGASSRREDVSMLEYYCYRCHYRLNQPNPYTCCGRLSDQIKVDAYSCVECDRFGFCDKKPR